MTTLFVSGTLLTSPKGDGVIGEENREQKEKKNGR
jgi:hypothetical protein